MASTGAALLYGQQLLVPSPVSRGYPDSGVCHIIQGLEEIIVRSKLDIYALLDRGSAKRRTAETALNKQSSRSHSVFCVTVRSAAIMSYHQSASSHILRANGLPAVPGHTCALQHGCGLTMIGVLSCTMENTVANSRACGRTGLSRGTIHWQLSHHLLL